MKTEQKTIGEHKYTCTQMKGMLGTRVFTRLVRLLGEPVLRFIVSSMEDKKQDQTMSQLVMVAGHAFAQLDEEEIDRTIRDMFTSCMKVDSTMGVESTEETFDVMKIFDVHFAGRVMHLLAVVQFALEVNYHDFFDAFPLTLGGMASQGEDTKE